MKSTNNSFKEIDRILNKIEIDFGGGCSAKKAKLISYLIEQSKSNSSIDIGVYKGRSLLPQAITFKNIGEGIAFGVDPYSSAAAKEQDDPEIDGRPNLKNEIDKFVKETDFEKLFKVVQRNIKDFKLSSHCQLIKKTSTDAFTTLENKGPYGLIHIDGNHDNIRVKEDLKNYLPLIKADGFLVMDDISWEPIKRLLPSLNKECSLVFQLVDQENDFAIYIKSKKYFRVLKTKKMINKTVYSLDHLA